MTLKRSKREEFLLTMYTYLKGGFDNYLADTDTYSHDPSINGRKERSHEDVMAILNNKEQFLAIDVVNDELDYFGLDIDDFEWEDKALPMRKFNILIEPSIAGVKWEDEFEVEADASDDDIKEAAKDVIGQYVEYNYWEVDQSGNELEE